MVTSACDATCALLDECTAIIIRALDVRSTCLAACASKRWLLLTDQYREALDFSNARDRHVPKAALMTLTRRARAVCMLILPRSPHVDDDVLKAVAPKLLPSAVVDVSRCGAVTDDGIRMLQQSCPAARVHCDGCWRVHNPDPAHTPAHVVVLQLLALAAARDSSQKAAAYAKCFSFASPANQAATGPAARFGHMIEHGYRIMIFFDTADILVRQPSEHQCSVFTRLERSHPSRPSTGAVDIVMHMSATDEMAGPGQGEVRVTSLFHWQLSKQPPASAHAGCWMTDSVMPETNPHDDPVHTIPVEPRLEMD